MTPAANDGKRGTFSSENSLPTQNDGGDGTGYGGDAQNDSGNGAHEKPLIRRECIAGASKEGLLVEILAARARARKDTRANAQNDTHLAHSGGG